MMGVKWMRSIFSRYMLTFAVLILLAFGSIAVIISVLLNSMNNNAMSSSMTRLTDEVAVFIDEHMEPQSKTFAETVDECVRYKRITHLSAVLSMTTVITDRSGKTLAVFNESDAYRGEPITEHAADMLYDAPRKLHHMPVSAGASSVYSMLTPYTFADGSGVKTSYGSIIVLADGKASYKTTYSAILSIVICSIWVLSTAVIALYFIGDRLNRPMRDISKCLDRFEAGDYSVRMNTYRTNEFNEIATSFNAMASAIESIEHSRRMFISDISHDLRTPMTKIKGFVDAILDGTVPPEKRDYYLGIVSTEITRLSRLVSTLLDISRMESGKQAIDPEVFDVCEIVRLIVISFEDKFTQKKIDFELDADDYNSFVYADHDAIYQVLYNLIDNAVKFTEDSGRLKVLVKRTQRGAKYAVTVYNTGIGIKKEELSCVFDRFFKADVSRGYDKTGVGLGLFIVKTKLDLHGEHITVQSEYGKDCSFTFELPAGERPKKKPAAPTE